MFIEFLNAMDCEEIGDMVRRLFIDISISLADGYETRPILFEHQRCPGMCGYIFLFRRGGFIWLHVEFGFFKETDLTKKDIDLQEFINRRENNPVLLQGVFIDLKTFLVQSTSSYKEDRKAYVSEFNISDYTFWFIQYYVEYVLLASKRTQYHHYIPRFILRNFAVDSNPMKKKHINLYSYPRTEALRPIHEEAEIATSYGAVNMYQNENEQMEKESSVLEKSLSVLEGSCAKMIMKIVNSDTYTCSRNEIAKLQKFLFVMWYRHDVRRSSYQNLTFNLREISEFIERVGIGPAGVWLNNIAQLLDTDHKRIATNDRILPSVKRGYLHALSSTLCIWEACIEDEFILTDGCFGCSIKDPGSNVYYNVYPIHPRVALVTYGNPGSIAFPNSIIPGSLVMKPIIEQTPSQEIGHYKKITVPRIIVNIVNGNILHRCMFSITYMREDRLMRYVRYYDVMKQQYFAEPQDFTWLKKDLFRRLNRTHP
jgi:hypothetical protein